MHGNPYSRWLFSQHIQPQTALNPFPPVNTQALNRSAQKFQELLKQADLLTSKIVNSEEFAHELMDAAQLSKTKQVEELIRSAGITLKIKTVYNPTSIRIELNNAEDEGGCCKLLMALQW